MKTSRTRQGPMFTTDRPHGPDWHWDVKYTIGTQGYAHGCSVTAWHMIGKELIEGTVFSDIRFDDDPLAVAEILLWEAAIHAAEQRLPGLGGEVKNATQQVRDTLSGGRR